MKSGGIKSAFVPKVSLLALALTAVLSSPSVLAEALQYQIEVRVTQVGPDTAADPDWPVYIYAAVPGSRVPLSSIRVSLKELPITVTLNETMYVLPQFTLKGVEQVELVAKLSTSGDPHKPGKYDRAGRSQVVAIAPGNVARAEVVLQP
ncbi:MAG: hypothetical protein OIF57_00360 [Marinobacterium sp.]|nr:hypothetical protein [Marinobacterium sp.]